MAAYGFAPGDATVADADSSAATGADATSGVTFDGKTWSNRLIHSHDPYLLLHAHNPVDWYPWGPEALAKAKRENKPIFLSVGYSTCYWCHVAERQIYSDPAIAEQMNAAFVNIKVDREERPDVDRVYMLATQFMTGRGGWPNNVFLTPDLKPFFAGSYFPPTDQGGRPGFPTILARVQQAWTTDQAKLLAVADNVHQALRQIATRTPKGNAPAPDPGEWLARAVSQSVSLFDPVHGGFSGGGETMFPQQPQLAMLLAAYRQSHNDTALSMLTQTLAAMAEGGVMDQLAGGFHRYSTEPSWSVPHFEKMLYDNAQLLGLYAQAYAITRRPLFKQVAMRTAHYLTTQMLGEGGFYSAQDAEVGGVEGASYVWSADQIEAVLGKADAQRFLALYALVPVPANPAAGESESPGGALRLGREKAQALATSNRLAEAIAALAPLRAQLLAARNRRPQPARDEKIVTADNGLAILALAQASEALQDRALLQIAVETANWLWQHAFDPRSGLLRHQFFHGHAGEVGLLDDYALLGQSFLALRHATADTIWQQRARQVADAMLTQFARRDGSLMSTTDTQTLLLAPPSEGDSVRPSGHSAAVALLLSLAIDSGDARYATAAQRALAPLAAQIAAQPGGWGALLTALAPPAAIAALNTAAPSPVPSSAAFPDSADHVQAQARWAPAAQGAELWVTIDIAPGFHINANPASDPKLIPTQLTLTDQPGLRVEYPPAQVFKAPFAPQGIAVYSGQVKLHALLAQVPETAMTVRLRVQACDDAVCLAPATITVPLSPAAH